MPLPKALDPCHGEFIVQNFDGIDSADSNESSNNGFLTDFDRLSFGVAVEVF